MELIYTRCPGCRTKFGVKPDQADKKLKCPHCSTAFRIKALGERAAVKVAKADDDLDFLEPDDDSPLPPTRKGGGAKNVSATPARTGKLPPARRNARLAAQREVTEKPKKARRDEEQDEGANRMMLVAGIGGGGVLFLGMIVAAFFLLPKLMGSGDSAADAPQIFEEYAEPSSAVLFEYPKGWKVTHGGGTGGVPRWATLEGDGVKVFIRDSAAGATIGDVARAGRAGLDEADVDEELEPVHQLHLLKLQELEFEHTGYEETAPETIDTKMGEARLSEYVRPATFGSTYGYRATMPPGVRQFNVITESSKKKFEALKPTLRRIIVSVANGSN